jgi:cellulose biosynthesis protein BcsQ
MQNGLVCLVTPCGEIGNYSQDMVSAIHLNISEKDGLLESINKIKLVIRDKDLYNNISNNAFTRFNNQLTYKESLKESIESFLIILFLFFLSINPSNDD